MAPNPLLVGTPEGQSIVPSAAARDNGWIIPYLQQAVKSNSIVVPLSRCRVMVTTSLVRLGYSRHDGLSSLFADAKIALQGQSDKQLAVGPILAGANVTTVTLTSLNTFGVVVRVARSIADWNRATKKPTISLTINGVATDFTVLVAPTEEYSEFLLLAAQNAAGLGKVSKATVATFTVATETAANNIGLNAGDFVSIETLTNRDLGLR